MILDEINSYEDSPSELIFDEFENLLFDGHALGHNILGDEAVAARFRQRVRQVVYEAVLCPPKTWCSSRWGRIPFKKIVQMAESTLSDIAFPVGGT